MKYKRNIEGLALRIKDYETTMLGMSADKKIGWKEPGSLNKKRCYRRSTRSKR